MARFNFRLPDIGEGIAEAEIVALHIAVGDRITEDQGIADMMTDKATVEMESPVTGTVVEIAGGVGDVIAIGSTLVVIETDAADDDTHDDRPADTPAPAIAQMPDRDGGIYPPEQPAVPAATQSAAAPLVEAPPVAAPDAGQPERASGPAILASPAVRDRAKALQIALSDVRPGADGRIRHADLDAFLRYNAGQGFIAPHAAPRTDEQVRVVGMRRRIAENMAASKRAIPHFSYVEEIEVTALEAMRADLNANRGDRAKLTILPFLIVAICRTVPQFPMINARYDDDAGVVIRHGAVHLGMATQTDAGLMVPVIRDAHSLNVWQLSAEIARLAGAARSGKAKSEDLSGSTLTITSLGPLGGIATTPVINRPEVAIIGPNRIIERPVFENAGPGNGIRRAKLMNMSISCDHRVVDGWDAASFIQALKKLIETPVLLFAD